MDNPALIDRGSAWLAEAANAEQAKTHDARLRFATAMEDLLALRSPQKEGRPLELLMRFG